MKPKIMFVATTPWAVNPFLATHLIALAEHYHITLCVNLKAYELLPELNHVLNIVHVDFERKISFWRDLKSLFQLLRAIFKVRPVAIHSITPKAGLLAMLAGSLARVPNRWHTFTGQVWATKQGVSRRFLKVLDRVIVFLASRVFADSASQCRFLQREGVVQDGGIAVLGGGSIAGVDLGRFRPDAQARLRLRQELGCGNGYCVFLFAGRLSRDKGIFDLVAAFTEVARVIPFVELWVLGPNDEGLLVQLEQAGSQSAATIRWLGPTFTPEKFMAAADVLVLPSYREGFGSVIIEAAACAIPCVAYRVDGVIDAVSEGQSGLLVEKGQISALTSAMCRLAGDKVELQRLGQQARTRAEQQFCSLAVTAAWLSFYQHALEKEA